MTSIVDDAYSHQTFSAEMLSKSKNNSRDFLTVKERSELMSKIKGKDTRPEKFLRNLLHRKGFRFRLHQNRLPGRPDIVLTRYHVAIFVNGCFWHAHNCKKGRKLPKTNKKFWQEKLFHNKKRDLENIKLLRSLGWHVIVFWECQMKDESKVFKKLKGALIK